MFQIRIFTLNILAILLFSACDSCHDDEPLAPAMKRIVRMVTLNSNEWQDYAYDDKGRLMETLDEAGYRETYSYSDTKITQNAYYNGAFQYSLNYDLNSKGLLNGYDVPNGENVSFQYDNEDRLIKIINSHSNGNTSTIDFIFSGGNCIKFQNSANNSYMVKEYRLGDKNTLSNQNFGRTFAGKDSKNLLQSETFTNQDGSKVITFYDYDLDSEGYVLKQYKAEYYPNNPNPYQTVIEYYYE